MSARDRRRRRWCRKHSAHVRTLERQLNRRPPLRYRTVWCVDWMLGGGDEKVTWCDWGEPTRRKAIDKAMREQAQLDRDLRRVSENFRRYDAMMERM